MTQRLLTALFIAAVTGCAAAPMDTQTPEHETLQLSPTRRAATGVVRLEADRATNTVTAYDTEQHVAFQWAGQPGDVAHQFNGYSACLYSNYVVNEYDLETADYVCAM
jgi:hypothetical protein